MTTEGVTQPSTLRQIAPRSLALFGILTVLLVVAWPSGLAAQSASDPDTILVLDPFALIVNEGDDATYTVRLAAQPSSEVEVTIGPTEAGLSVEPEKLRFNSENYDVERTVTVSADEDADREDGTGTITHKVDGGGYDEESAEDLAVTVTDDDLITLSETDLEIAEFKSATYTVVLKSQPDNPVTVTVGYNLLADLWIAKPRLTFTPDNWDEEQTVTVQALGDYDVLNDTVLITHWLEGVDYPRRDVGTVKVTINDPDTYGVEVSPTSMKIVEGKTGTYTIRLEAEPQGNVTIDIGGTDDSDVSVDPETIVFVPARWSSQHTVTVTAGDDADIADDAVTLTHTVTGGGYDDVDVSDVGITVVDQDGNQLVLSDAELTISEGNLWGISYGVKLQQQPFEDVTVTIGGNADSLLSVHPNILTFTTETWNTGQSVRLVDGRRIQIRLTRW